MQPNYAQPYPGQPYPGQPYPPQYVQPKDWFLTLVLAIFLGTLGVHRFYTGKIVTGILMLVTFGGCGIWWLIDVIMIATGSFTDSRKQPLVRTE